MKRFIQQASAFTLIAALLIGCDGPDHKVKLSSAPDSGAPSPDANSISDQDTLPAPKEQIAFVEAAIQARGAFDAAETDMQKGATRPMRAKALCSALKTNAVKSWVGKITEISTNNDGKDVIEITIGDAVTVKTWNNDLSDFEDHTLIEPGSALYQHMLTMKVGDTVKFTGNFKRSKTDCVAETSMTLAGSITEPEFLFRFASIEPL